MAAAALMALAACSTVASLWTGGPKEQPRVREGALALGCDGGKTLLVRIDPGKSAWVILPEREFRLDAAAGTGESRYSNGRATLTATGEEMSFEEPGAPSFTHCRKPQS